MEQNHSHRIMIQLKKASMATSPSSLISFDMSNLQLGKNGELNLPVIEARKENSKKIILSQNNNSKNTNAKDPTGFGYLEESEGSNFQPPDTSQVNNTQKSAFSVSS